MGVDVYFHWPSQSPEEYRAQFTGYSTQAGKVGYLREAYHGEPYATEVLVPEAFGASSSEAGEKMVALLRSILGKDFTTGVIPVTVSPDGKQPTAKNGPLTTTICRMAAKAVADGQEGLVVRTPYPFHYATFEGYDTVNSNDGRSWKVNAIAKWVRPNHVQTDEHWSHVRVVRNEVRGVVA
jgi:hypothetical protein